MKSTSYAVVLVGMLVAGGRAWGGQRETAAPLRLEVVVQPGAPLTAAQEWLAALRRAGVGSVRIRSSQAGARPEVQRDAQRATVVGVIDHSNRLLLPGGAFTLSQAGRIAGHLDRLVAAPPVASGSDDRLRRRLAAPVADPTAGQPWDAVLRALAEQVELPLDIAPGARQAMRKEGVVQDELQGVSVGTSLAYVLAERRLVLVPQKGEGAGLRIERRAVEQSAWPIGYRDPQPIARRIPRLMDFLPVAIRQTPLPVVLSALQQRLEVPMLVDRAALAARGIRMDAIRITLPEEETYYKKVLDRALFAARLRADGRLDDAGRPFLWIVPIQAASEDDR